MVSAKAKGAGRSDCYADTSSIVIAKASGVSMSNPVDKKMREEFAAKIQTIFNEINKE